MLKLHFARNTVSAATAIALHEAGLDFELVPVDFANAAQTKPPFLALNPKGRVPVLETPEGPLTETGALLEWVAAQAPHAGLVPDDAFQAAKMREMMCYLGSTMHINHAHGMRGARWADDPAAHAAMAAKVNENMIACCAYVEPRLAGPYVLGDGFSLADPYLFTVCTWLPGDHVDITQFPKLAAHHTVMKARRSVQTAHAQGFLKEFAL
ncbi:glutathione S-transferase family protein [Aquicoccus sp. G2-2]|uniref:glutathione S-transferase family protein n=1 Tax=Aquicoccus sp. G2-2 TaxID=3092120 RepID=UPI002ADF1879|nr:glutathione S-transferase family protein [Aquicoccus sp. G2-2]MEA1115135.1 glutathione S-transferase family protein [Aquicoccus sp. G2-2]